jgi:hypothetical protein
MVDILDERSYIGPHSARSFVQERGSHMPLINVKLVEGVFDTEQKQRIVRT